MFCLFFFKCLFRITGTVSVEVDDLIYDIISGHTVVNIPQGMLPPSVSQSGQVAEMREVWVGW